MRSRQLTPRERVLLVATSALLVGLVVPALALSLTDRARSIVSVCGSGVPGASTVCTLAGHSTLRATIALVVVLLVGVLVLRGCARWALRPVAELADQLDRVGPQNLGYRLRADGEDELALLSHAVDDMMDRVAVSFEGQKRFAANASHELRTPLAVQRTLIEVGLAQPLTPDQLALLTRQLLETNERNERLIEGLLVLSESDQGLRSRSPQRLDEIARAVAAAYEERAAEAGVAVRLDLQPRVVLGEQVLLERLVTNLVQNAVKYNRPGGCLEVAVADDPALTVASTGPAVPNEAVASLFEPFRRLASDRTDHSGGAGLGLTIARSITQAHDGTISAEPRGTDGLRVDVRLPRAEGAR
ncbi:signal transduction histidine kinase [Motilibacter rhizosphaerae]|uniref:histidine kinase n=1 Tax=Motilibacter rhizosphaerae TaxID=598652 RepID=A0A4Q7NFN2_9ACTN|nr:HAMP domain-containing sensor histidine kinase [Motilibacter rhizosphaerae]RZS82701.1 signal transduction histidine kinase [Motilibacter rhizosphaerae]